MTLSSGLPPTRFDYAAPVPPIAALGAVHLIGIGGAGMSAIARMLLARGLLVTGSDSRESASVDALTRDGIGIRIGQDAANVTGVQTVVVSSAIREDNPELAARAAGLRVMHRSQALAALAADSPVRIAIAGANGKTTTRRCSPSSSRWPDATCRMPSGETPCSWTPTPGPAPVRSRHRGRRERRLLLSAITRRSLCDQRAARPPRLLRHRRGGGGGLSGLRRHP
jgi:hypothetical protein